MKSYARVAINIHLLAFIALSAIHANAQTPGQLNWDDIPDPPPQTIINGKYYMSWDSISGGSFPDNYFFDLKETVNPDIGATRTVHHYLDTNEAHFFNQDDGSFTYEVRACYFDEDRLRICGPWSSSISVDLSLSGYSHPAQMPWDYQGSPPTGPDTLFPGAYRSSRATRNGWSLHWANNLRRDETNDMFGDYYDLVVLWLTHKWDDSVNRYVPVWMYSKMQYITPDSDTLTGTLYYRYEQTPGSPSSMVNAIVGDLEFTLDPSDNRLVTADWAARLRGLYRYENSVGNIVSDQLSHITHPNPPGNDPVGQNLDPNPNDHFQGLYQVPSGNDYDETHIVLTAIFKSLEMIEFLFLADDGHPMWVVAHNGDGTPALPITTSSMCASYVLDAGPPDTFAPDDWRGTDIHTDCDPTNYPAGGTNLERSFDPVAAGASDRFQDIWADVSITQGRSGDFEIEGGTQGSPVQHKKRSHFHDIRFRDSSGLTANDECEHAPNSPCNVELLWFRDGHYLHAAVFLVSEDPPVTRTRIAGGPSIIAPSVPNFPYNISGDDGNYSFELRAGSTETSALLAKTKTIYVDTVTAPEPEVPPAPASDPGFVPPDSSAEVGATRGDFRVNESGAATYSIPVMTLEGSGGVHPEISFNYNSHNGDGPMGPGWGIGGLSTITRCAKTRVQGDLADDYIGSYGVTLDDSDRFCLDGQRLILVDGVYGQDNSEYRKEIDDYTRIIAHGSIADGPAYFSVEKRDGSISYYGFGHNSTSTSSSVFAKNDSNQDVVFAWPVTRMEDSVGNYVRYEYLQPGSSANPSWIEWRISKILYTGNDFAGMQGETPQQPFAEIQFQYHTLPVSERDPGYVNENVIQRSKRLDWVDSVRTFPSLETLRHYDLHYDVDEEDGDLYLLEMIEECSGSTASDVCYEPIIFEWNEGISSIDPNVRYNIGSITEDVISVAPADVNKDGLPDIIAQIELSGDDPGFRTFINNGMDPNGEVTFIDAGTAAAEAPNPNNCDLASDDLGQWGLVDLGPGSHSGPNGLHTALIYAIKCDSNSSLTGIYAKRWSGSNFSAAEKVADISSSFVSQVQSPIDVIVTDIIGNGANDLVIYSDDPNFGTLAPPFVGVYKRVIDDPLDFEIDEYISPQTGYFLEPQFLHINHALQLEQAGWPGFALTVTDFGATPDETYSGLFGISRHPTQNYLYFEEQNRLYFDTNIAQHYISADFNNDGNPDFVGFTENGSGQLEFIVTTNTDGSAIHSIAEMRSCNLLDTKGNRSLYPFSSAYDATLIDYTGDGHRDLLIPIRGSDPGFVDRYCVHPWLPATNTFKEDAVISTNVPLGDHIPAGDVDDGARIIRVDIDANGRDDLLEFNGFSNLYIYPGEVSQDVEADEPIHKITSILDSFGAETKIEYKRIADKSVYTPENNGPYFQGGSGATAVVYDYSSSMFLVSRVSSSAPSADVTPSNVSQDSLQLDITSETCVEYHYRGGKVQGGGRGFLGFNELATFDNQGNCDDSTSDGVLSVTIYNQEFPKTGLPSESFKRYVTGHPWLDTSTGEPLCPNQSVCGEYGYRDGVMLANSAVDWGYITTASINSYFVFEVDREESTYTAVNNTSSGIPICSAHTKKVHTYKPTSQPENSFDSYGNPIYINTDVYQNTTDYDNATEVCADNSEPAQLVEFKSVQNWYDNIVSSSSYHLGRLTATRVTANRPNSTFGLPETRFSTFSYYPDTGLLQSEVANADSELDDGLDGSTGTVDDGKIRKFYTYDKWGNRTSETVYFLDIKGAEQVRESMATYDAYIGQHIESESALVVADGQSSPSHQTLKTVDQRDKFGNPLQVSDGKGNTSLKVYDKMGRPYYSYKNTGAWERTTYMDGQNISVFCPADTVFAVIMDDAAGKEKIECKDILARTIRTVTQGFGPERHLTDVRYDYASRQAATSVPVTCGPDCLDGDKGSTGPDIPEFLWNKTVYDTVGREWQVWQPSGQTGVPEKHIVKQFLGLKVERDVTFRRQDSGGTTLITRTHTEVSNAFGETVKTIRPDGAETTYSYDARGNLITVDGPASGSPDPDVITMAYDDFDNKISVDDPDKGFWQYHHNPLGEIECQLDARGYGTYVTYDKLGRKVFRADMQPESGASIGISDCSGLVINKGETTWTWSNQSGSESFGDLLSVNSFYDKNAAPGSNSPDYSGKDLEYTYGDLGRIVSVRTTITDGPPGSSRSKSGMYLEETSYDQYGRTFQEFDASQNAGPGARKRGIRYVYNEHGYLKEIKEAADGALGEVYLTIDEIDKWGNVTRSNFGNNTISASDYHPVTGKVEHVYDTTGEAIPLDIQMDWDGLGNLQFREDTAGARDQREDYIYDNLDRLREVHYTKNSPPPMSTDIEYISYDVTGNIDMRTGVGTYDYGVHDSSCGLSYDPGPHAATMAGSDYYCYDRNGNVISDDFGNGRQYEYTTYDKLISVETSTGLVSEYAYGHDRSRYKRVDTDSSGAVSVTHYVGSVEIVDADTAGSKKYRRYIAGVLVKEYDEATDTDKESWLHKDHQGSIAAITDEQGFVEEWLSYDAFGQRRNADAWYPYMAPTQPTIMAIRAITIRGYTGHEHIDIAHLIHMNGRIYDPRLGRFLQADPFMEDTGTLNRYTYVHNNPLKYSDPSGYFSIGDAVQLLAGVVGSIAFPQILLSAGGIFATEAGALFAYAASGALTAVLATGDISEAGWGAFSATVFYGIGRGFHGVRGASGTGVFGSGYTVEQYISKAIAHGMAGGAIRELRGGKFGHGFVPAFTSSISSGIVSDLPIGDHGQTVVAAIIGGSVSEATGGKFANGAITAAFSFAFNDKGQHPNEVSPDQIEYGINVEFNLTRALPKNVRVALDKMNIGITVDKEGLVVSSGLIEGNPTDLGYRVTYQGDNQYLLRTPAGDVQLSHHDMDIMFGVDSPVALGWGAGVDATFNPKFELSGSAGVLKITGSATIELTSPQRAMLTDKDSWLRNISGGAPIGWTPDGN